MKNKFVWARHVDDKIVALGHVTVTGSKLVFDCNSKERLSRGTEQLQRIGHLELVDKEINDARHLLEERMKSHDATSASTEDECLEATPEVQAYLRQSIGRHYEDWVKKTLPALDGQTPRQAAKRPASRQKLIDLLREMEYGDRRKAGDTTGIS